MLPGTWGEDGDDDGGDDGGDNVGSDGANYYGGVGDDCDGVGDRDGGVVMR